MPDRSALCETSRNSVGMCLVATGHPMDLIKVNMQTMEKPKAGEAPMYSSALDCARKIVAKDGVRSYTLTHTTRPTSNI